jgi:hypothetical protein
MTMISRVFSLVGVVLGLVTLASLHAAPNPAPPKPAVKLIQAKRDAARKTYEAVWRNNREALLPFVEIAYRWSHRWLEAERELSEQKADQIAALERHLNRMRELERITRERFRAKVVPLEEASAAEFYSLEAEIWLTQERGKDK